MSKYIIENNAPATEASIQAVEKALGLPLPDCLKTFLLEQDGLQVYENRNSITDFYACVLATDAVNIRLETPALHPQYGEIVERTFDLRGLSDMWAEEDDA